MEYPFWLTPGISGGLIIAVISVLHVFVAQFAVGGGIYLVWMESRAHKLRSPELLEWLHGHTRFFLLLTMVFGGLSGVAIWFSITVASTAATSMLAYNFLFVWASEWVFFLVEIISLLIYYYTYAPLRQGRFSPALHMRIGWIYAAAGITSLFLINGIVTFMLTPGKSLETRSVIDAFFNPTFWPSMAYRTALSLMLAGMFALFTAVRISPEPLKRMVIRGAGLWICLPLLILAASSVWYYLALPPERQAAMARRTADIHPFVKAHIWILPLILVGGALAFARAQRLRRPLSVLILCAGLVLVGSFEWIRETGRRPWIAPGYMYSNGVTVAEAETMNRSGVASVSGWTRLLADPAAAQQARVSPGGLLFEQQCGACHGINGPRLDIVPLLERLSPQGVRAQLAGQGHRLEYMPPFFGSPEDRETLARFLNSLRTRP